MVPAFVLKERHKEGKLEKKMNERKKEGWKEWKEMKERTVGIISSLNVKCYFDICGRIFFDSSVVGAEAGYLIVVHDIYISCSIQWLFQQIPKATSITVFFKNYYVYVCLLYFILWPLLIWVEVLKLPQFSQVEKKSA